MGPLLLLQWISRFLLLVAIGLFTGVVAHAQESGDRGLHRVPLQAVTQKGENLSLYKQSHALLIGVGKYSNGWSNLDSVSSELDSLQTTLEQKGFNVVRVDNPNTDALRQSIVDFINNYGYEPDNRLLFFFSGHGHSDASRGYIVPSDAPLPDDDSSDFKRSAISMNQFMTWARDIESKHAMFMFDSCFSGSVFTSKNVPSAEERYIQQATRRPVRQFITAGSANEVVPAKSTFTPALVDALNGSGDLNNDGYITGSELGVHLSQLVPRFEDQTPQYGKIRDYNLAQGDFVFFVPSSPPVEIDARPQIDLQAPVINHQPASSSQKGLMQTFNARVSDQEVSEVYLHYQTSDGRWQQQLMTASSSDNFFTTVDVAENQDTLRYFISAADTSGNASQRGSKSNPLVRLLAGAANDTVPPQATNTVKSRPNMIYWVLGALAAGALIAVASGSGGSGGDTDSEAATFSINVPALP